MSENDGRNSYSIEENVKFVEHLFSKKRNQVKPVDDGVIGEDGAKERDKRYTTLLDIYSKTYSEDKKVTNKQKKTYFNLMLVLFVGLLVVGVVLLFLGLYSDNINSVAVVIGASVDILGAFIAIPTIIARHLFPEKMDNGIIEIVKLLVENDKHVREIKEKHISEQNKKNKKDE